MSLHQFANSLQQILSNPHVSSGTGVLRHVGWQCRRALNLFPFVQKISASKIVAAHRRCGVSALIHNQGMYDYDNMKFVQWLLQPGGTFFDIGANIGAYTLLASEQDGAHVLAFEPHPGTFALLSENVGLNRRQNVRLFQAALGHRHHAVYLTNVMGSPTNHVVERESSHEEPSNGIQVPCFRAEQICEELGVVPDVVKLDVEGFEFDVLCGFGGFLKSIGALLVEMNGLSDQRGAGRQSIHLLLASRGLKGPYRCRFNLRRLDTAQDQGVQDHVYVNAAVLNRLVQSGWVVEALA